MKKPQLADTQDIWKSFAEDAALTLQQLDLFKRYYLLLQAANKTISLTTIINERDVINYHFKDSLHVANILNMATIKHAADIGTGGGFPGVALAIKYPQLMVTLIEVNTKKIQFLDTVITELGLSDRISVFDEDWRTFLRTTSENIQLFCARASLQPEELIRLFKPASPYKNSVLVYWASSTWQPSTAVAPYITKDIAYTILNRNRRLILLQNVQKDTHE